MRDLFSWSLPLGRVIGISVRMHVWFPFVATALVLRVAFAREQPAPPAGTIWDAVILVGILAASVLLHEFGHCLAARRVGGDAHEIVLWPLGGLASLELPQRPRAHFLAAAGGPSTNFVICFLVAGLLFWYGHDRLMPPLHPFWSVYRDDQALARLTTWQGQALSTSAWTPTILARIFWVNWILFLINLLPGFPLDGGRMLQALLWPRFGFRSALMFAIYAGFVTVLVVGVLAIAYNEMLTLCLALFMFAANRQQLILLETGGEESVFGYDFSQGYTSLESGNYPSRRPGFWQRWQQARLARKLQRDMEQRETEERRMDELLEKVQRVSWQGLTEEERRFLRRVSERYRHRQ
jgi:Zn-dependent protease